MKYFVFLILLIFIFGCSQVSKEEAETEALKFVESNVKFFAREGEDKLNLPKYNYNNIISYQQGNNWIVTMSVSAELNGETKKNDLTVKLNNIGKVIEFNGKSLVK